MNNFDNQINRIKKKLAKAKNVDRRFKVFGADEHKYFIGKPVLLENILKFEKEFELELPLCYKLFLLNIGSIDFDMDFPAKTSVGPECGLYSFDSFMQGNSSTISIDLRKSLKNECTLFPEMTKKYWEKITKKIDCFDDDKIFESEINKI